MVWGGGGCDGEEWTYVPERKRKTMLFRKKKVSLVTQGQEKIGLSSYTKAWGKRTLAP
jgi:hypothetical protein